MINTHYSQYRILPKRQAGRPGRPREKTVARQSPALQREGGQPDSRENLQKGNHFDEFA